MSIREDRIKRRLLQRQQEERLRCTKGKPYKALSPVGRPLPNNPEPVKRRAKRADWEIKKAWKPKYVPSTERAGYDESQIEVIEPEEFRFRKTNLGKRGRDK